jgi:hypothetical protein
MPETTRPSDATVKRLFAVSGNRCAYPSCTVQIVQGETVIGQICHIKAASANGPRFDEKQTPSDRQSYENLMLLCANHHKVIDDDPEAFTTERLLRMKSDHENRTAALAQGDIEHGSQLLIDQAVTTTNQSGGITAHIVHQTIHVHGATARSATGADRNSIIARLRKLHEDRVEAIASGSAAVTLLDSCALAIHVLPFSAADERPASSFESISENPDRFRPMKGQAHNVRIDYDGLLTASNARGMNEPQRAYVMVFRNGAVEAVACSLARGRNERFLSLPELQSMIVKHTYQYAKALVDFGLVSPIAVFVSLIGVEGKELLQAPIGSAFWEDLPSATLTHARLRFAESVFDEMPADYKACAKLLRPILDHLANASGLASSPYFDAEGNFTVAG